MRSVLPALLVPFLLASGPALSGDPGAGRVARQRTVRVHPEDRTVPRDVRIAGGLATLVTLDVALDSMGPRLDREDAHVRLVAVEGSSFLILPTVDLPDGERLLLSVPLERGSVLSLELRSVSEEVDVQVEFRLQDPTPDDERLISAAKLLSLARAEPTELASPMRPLLGSGNTLVRLRSVLRVDHHLFVSFLWWERESSLDVRQRILLRAILESGAIVALPVLQVTSGMSDSPRRQFTFVSVLPMGAVRLEVAARGEGTSEDSLSLSLVRVRRTP